LLRFGAGVVGASALAWGLPFSVRQAHAIPPNNRKTVFVFLAGALSSWDSWHAKETDTEIICLDASGNRCPDPPPPIEERDYRLGASGNTPAAVVGSALVPDFLEFAAPDYEATEPARFTRLWQPLLALRETAPDTFGIGVVNGVNNRALVHSLGSFSATALWTGAEALDRPGFSALVGNYYGQPIPAFSVGPRGYENDVPRGARVPSPFVLPTSETSASTRSALDLPQGVDRSRYLVRTDRMRARLLEGDFYSRHVGDFVRESGEAAWRKAREVTLLDPTDALKLAVTSPTGTLGVDTMAYGLDDQRLSPGAHRDRLEGLNLEAARRFDRAVRLLRVPGIQHVFVTPYDGIFDGHAGFTGDTINDTMEDTFVSSRIVAQGLRRMAEELAGAGVEATIVVMGEFNRTPHAYVRPTSGGRETPEYLSSVPRPDGDTNPRATGRDHANFSSVLLVNVRPNEQSRPFRSGSIGVVNPGGPAYEGFSRTNTPVDYSAIAWLLLKLSNIDPEDERNRIQLGNGTMAAPFKNETVVRNQGRRLLETFYYEQVP
jgi:hypothetical protein